MVVCELLPVSHFHKMTNETYAILKNDKEVTSNFPISTPASTSSFCSFCSHYPMLLPPLSPQSFSPQPTPQPHPPLSDFSPTHFPPATGSVIPSYHPTLMTSMPSSFPVPSIPSTCHPVHPAPFPITPLSVPVSPLLSLLSSPLNSGLHLHSSHSQPDLLIHKSDSGS